MPVKAPRAPDHLVAQARKLYATGLSTRAIAPLIGMTHWWVYGAIRPIARKKGEDQYPHLVERARELYASGLGCRPVAAALNVPQSWVLRTVKSIRRPMWGRRFDHLIPQARRLYLDGLSTSEIASILGGPSKKWVLDNIRPVLRDHREAIALSGAKRAKHGESDGSKRRGSREYKIWSGIKGRCYYPARGRSYKYYGGRGITMCEEWRTDFSAFLRDMGRRPGPGYSIDRIDPDGNYEPGNCRWATVLEQRHNRRDTRKQEGARQWLSPTAPSSARSVGNVSLSASGAGELVGTRGSGTSPKRGGSPINAPFLPGTARQGSGEK